MALTGGLSLASRIVSLQQGFTVGAGAKAGGRFDPLFP
jgi:hypothetical protein